MKKLSNSTLILLLGIVIFLLGCIQPARYEAAKEKGYEVEATIVKVVQKEETNFEAPDTTACIIYADYEVDGQKYEGVRVAKYYDTDDYVVGDTIKVVVNPNRPGSRMRVIGFLIMMVPIIHKIRCTVKKKKAKKQSKEAD